MWIVSPFPTNLSCHFCHVEFQIYKNPFKIFCLFVYSFVSGCAGSWLPHGLCLGAVRGAALHCGAWASHCSGFPCSGARARGSWASVVVASGPWSVGLVVVAHGLSCSSGKSSQTRIEPMGNLPRPGDWTHVPCIDRRILICCTTRKGQQESFEKPSFLFLGQFVCLHACKAHLHYILL